MTEKFDSIIFWINPIILVSQISFGIFGNLFNIFIFTRPYLRTNPCSIYFLASSVNNVFVIFVALIPRYLLTSWNIDPWTTNNILCKLRIFFLFTSLNLVLWLTVLASIDRYLLSSRNARYRQLSSLSIARKSITFTIIITYLCFVHILIFYRSDTKDNVMICGVFSNEYYIFFNLFSATTGFILPIISMSFFGILMIVNIRNIHNRVAPCADNARNERLRSSDRQLILMLLLQVFVTTLISIPYAVISTYSVFAITILRHRFSISEQPIFDFIYNLCRLLYYTNPVIGFYIYTLTSHKFRAQIKRTVRHGLKSGLTAIGLARYLPLRIQRVLLSENRMTN